LNRAALAFAGASAAVWVAGCAPALPPATSQDVDRVRTDRPWVTLEDLQRGRELFAQRCGACHAVPDLDAHPASEWPRLVRWMQGRAKLDSTGARQVEDWILSRKSAQAR